MNESRQSNDLKSESFSNNSDSDDSIVCKFVENILVSRANERTNLPTSKRVNKKRLANLAVNETTLTKKRELLTPIVFEGGSCQTDKNV